MEYFVKKDSVVRHIWGNSDTILFIFAGASAEFALNKAVDWLYFTGRLPSDPLGRLFSTVAYARKIVFSERHQTLKTIDAMADIHARVEANRGAKIPDWAYRDVLFMLIDYSVRSFEVLERKMSNAEKQEVYYVFYQVGDRMGVKQLPKTYEEWVPVRYEHLEKDLEYSHYTKDLFAQYRKHLGLVRYQLLLEAQALVGPGKVRELLGLGKAPILSPLLWLYKRIRELKVGQLLKDLVLPGKYLRQIKEMDQVYRS